MIVHRRAALAQLPVFAALLIAGCSITTPARVEFDPKDSHWQGRLAVKVLTASQRAFSATFDLQGSAERGSLRLATPLGTTLADLRWSPDSAVLLHQGQTQHFESLAALTRHATGAELPIAELFSWLRGHETIAPGWETDLRELPQGRISARHAAPDASTEIKIILDP